VSQPNFRPHNPVGQSGDLSKELGLSTAYTTQDARGLAAGDGLWNADGGYGVPLTITDISNTPQVIQLGQGLAKELQGVTIPGPTNILTHNHWKTGTPSVAPSYAVSADFSGAGAGIYSATIVFDYVLSR
jgi:hypothetical protein